MLKFTETLTPGQEVVLHWMDEESESLFCRVYFADAIGIATIDEGSLSLGGAPTFEYTPWATLESVSVGVPEKHLEQVRSWFASEVAR